MSRSDVFGILGLVVTVLSCVGEHICDAAERKAELKDIKKDIKAEIISDLLEES